MRRLREHQTVELELESADHAISCRVTAVAGAVATLAPAGKASRSSGLLTGASGYLVFAHRGILVALRGIAAQATNNEPEVDFVVTDGVVLPERRAAGRVGLATRVRIWNREHEHDQTMGVETITVNVSLGGMLVERRDGLDEESQFAIELFPDRDPAPIRCHAQRVRRTPTHLALKFSRVAEADRTRLAAIVDRHQRLGL